MILVQRSLDLHIINMETKNALVVAQVVMNIKHLPLISLAIEKKIVILLIIQMDVSHHAQDIMIIILKYVQPNVVMMVVLKNLELMIIIFVMILALKFQEANIYMKKRIIVILIHYVLNKLQIQLVKLFIKK